MRESTAALADRAGRMLQLERIEQSTFIEPLSTTTADEFCHGELGPIDYLSKPTVVRGGLTIPYGAPKVGKTTFVAHLVHGLLDPVLHPFLDGTTALGGAALWLDLEQPRRVSQRRFKEAGAHPNLHIYRGRSPSLEQLFATIDFYDIKLLVVDSMSPLLKLESENDNAEIESKLRPIQVELQRRDVTAIIIDHAGKADGPTGRTLRGGSAKLAIADIAVEVKIEGAPSECRRRLCFTSREEPQSDLIIKLDDGRFILEGTARSVAVTANRDRIFDGIRLGHQRKEDLAEHLKITSKTLEGWIKPFVDSGEITALRSAGVGRALVYHLTLGTSQKSLGSSHSGDAI